MTTVLAAFGLVFVAELGDKTQLVALGLGARHRLAPVVAGVVAAYLATSTLSVAVGGALGEALPTRLLSVVGGVLFLGFAAWTWFGSDEDGDEVADGPTVAGSRSVLVTVFAAMFVAELGDKTMIATATLAARENAVLVWVGATVGIAAAGILGVVAGRAIGARLPTHLLRRLSAALFAGFGAALLVTAL